MRLFWVLVVAMLGMVNLQAQCNGDSSLCSRRYDEVCYVTTHNAFNYQGAFLFPNQSHSVAQQLQAGVRGLMLDVYMQGGQPVVYHGNAFLGSQPLVNLLNDIKSYLDQNPTDVLTIIFECYITAAQMDAVFQQANLLAYAHVQPVGQPWPTLGDMIQSGKRLVVFTDASDTQGYAWYHHVWDFAVETHYTAYSRGDFDCNFNRGDSLNSLFILNHFVTQNPLGYGLIDSATAINANPYLLDRAMLCWSETHHFPNFLTVDFYERGDVFAVKDALNGSWTGRKEPTITQSSLQVFPNPNNGRFTLRSELRGPASVHVMDMRGITKFTCQYSGNTQEITLPLLPDGLYLLVVQKGDDRFYEKLLIKN